MALDKKTIAEIKTQLDERKKTLERQLAEFTQKNPNDPTDYNAKYPDMGSTEDENAMEVAAYSDQLSLERELEENLKDVNKALKSIKDGGYGTCKYCKKEIDIKRLMVRPESSSCIDCKTRLQAGEQL